MKPIGLSTLKAYLKKRGHEVRIVDLAQYAIREKGADEPITSVTTKLNIFKPVKESEKHLLEQKKISKAELLEIMLREIEKFRPDLLGVSFLTNNLSVAEEYFSFIKKQVKIPIIAGGIHPTVAPESAIRLDWVDMICIGYGERPLLEFLNSGMTDYSVPNLWFKKEGRIIRNAIQPSVIDFENYEFPDWDDYSDIQFYKPFQGKVMRWGDVELGRGCPYLCTFCVVSYLREKLGMRQCSRKPTDRMIKELAHLKNEYDIGIFRFWDELFLLVSDSQLREFAELYKKFFNLPFIIETTAESVTKDRAGILRDMGCVSVSIGIESGNDDLRNNVLNKRTPKQTYIDKFHLLNSCGINTTAYNMIGLPGETEEMIWDTIELNRACGVKTPSVGLFYPYPGTPLREYCMQNGYLEADFDDTTQEAALYTKSVLKQDHIIAPDKLSHYLEYFSSYCLDKSRDLADLKIRG
jgi:radical SAM superfamily enzyme YgiQ (UPF0313 family)